MKIICDCGEISEFIVQPNETEDYNEEDGLYALLTGKINIIAEHDLVENFEAEGRTKDGQSIWVSINIHAVRDPNGVILYLDGTNIDITTRKQMERELRQSKDELEAKNVLLTEEITESKRTEEILKKSEKRSI